MNKNKFEDFGKAMREARESHGMTQEMLRHALGCSRPMIARWEEGSNLPSGIYAFRIKNVLGINPSEYQKNNLKVGDSEFCSFLYKLREAACLGRHAFAKKIMEHGFARFSAWEGGFELPNIRIIDNIEKVFKGFPESEYIRIAWELEVDKLTEEEASKLKTFEKERGYNRKQETSDECEPEVESDNDAGSESVVTITVPAKCAPLGTPSNVRTIHVSIERIINRATKAGYKSSNTLLIKEFLQAFANVIVGETFNHIENRSYREIPWPLPPDVEDKRQVYIY